MRNKLASDISATVNVKIRMPKIVPQNRSRIFLKRPIEIYKF